MIEKGYESKGRGGLFKLIIEDPTEPSETNFSSRDKIMSSVLTLQFSRDYHERNEFNTDILEKWIESCFRCKRLELCFRKNFDVKVIHMIEEILSSDTNSIDEVFVLNSLSISKDK